MVSRLACQPPGNVGAAAHQDNNAVVPGIFVTRSVASFKERPDCLGAADRVFRAIFHLRRQLASRVRSGMAASDKR